MVLPVGASFPKEKGGRRFAEGARSWIMILGKTCMIESMMERLSLG